MLRAWSVRSFIKEILAADSTDYADLICEIREIRGSNFKRLQIRRYFHLPRFVGGNDVIFHCLDRFGLAVNEKCLSRRAQETAKPTENFAVIPVGGEAVDDMNGGAHGIIDAEDPDLAGTFR